MSACYRFKKSVVRLGEFWTSASCMNFLAAPVLAKADRYPEDKPVADAFAFYPGQAFHGLCSLACFASKSLQTIKA